MQQWFDPLVDEIVESVEEQMHGHSVKHLFLVGGFGDSPYLRDVLKKRLVIRNIDFTVLNESNAKAVADGAIIWSVKRAVTGRATRSAFGVGVGIPNALPFLLPEAEGRTLKFGPRGPMYEGGWSQIVGKSVVLAESQEMVETYGLNRKSSDPGSLEVTMYAYDGTDVPLFMKDVLGSAKLGFEEVCVVRADLSGMKGKMVPADGVFGKYWLMNVKVALRFGGTELSASILWEEDGVTHRSPASIIPSSFV